MRTLTRNQQNMKYALMVGEMPEYELDAEGNIVYIEVDGELVPVETGGTVTEYSTPTSFRGNISMSGGEAQAKEYGIDVSQYDAVLVLKKGAIPITETSLIWHLSEPKYKDSANMMLDEKSADYTVKRVAPSINFDKYLLQRIVK